MKIIIKSYTGYINRRNIDQSYHIYIQIFIEIENPLMKLNRSQSKNPYSLKINDMVKKEQQMQLDMTQKYNRFKKSASLQAYYVNQARLKKITTIYRSLTNDKLRTHSASKSQRQSNLHVPEKRSQPSNPFTQSSLNSLLTRQGKPKQKLTIDKGIENLPPSVPAGRPSDQYFQLLVRIKSVAIKLKSVLQQKSEQRFTREFKVICDMILHPRFDVNESKELYNCLNLFGECCEKREQFKIVEVKKNYAKFEEEFSTLQTELKKKSIKAVLTDKQIENYQMKIKNIEGQLAQLKGKLNTKKVEMCVGTDFDSISTIKDPSQNGSEKNIFLPTQFYNLTNTNSNCYQNNPNGHQCQCSQLLQLNKNKLEEYSKKIQAYNFRQKELLSVMVILQREGVDIERIYAEIVNGKIDVEDDQTEQFARATAKMKKQQNKIYKKYKDVKMNDSADADDSIISQADGLSFNYQDKSIEEPDVFTARNEYICKQDLGEEMKQKLKLNFNILYEQVDVYDVYSGNFDSQSENGPTI